MTARIISGTEVAKQVRERIAREVLVLRERTGVTPGLVTILVGDNPASVSYVTGKQRTARELGFHSVQEDQPTGISEERLLELIAKYNNDPAIHGILVQLPLPKHIDETRVLNAIDPDKDVGQLHAYLVLLVGRENVDDPVDGSRRVLGVQRCQHKVARFSRGDGRRDGLQVAHFPDHDHVRILPENPPEPFVEIHGVPAYFTLVYQRFLWLEDVLYGVFQRYYV